jgi:hypothetical protein
MTTGGGVLVMEQMSSKEQPNLETAFKTNEFYSGFGHLVKWYFSEGPKLFWQMIQ